MAGMPARADEFDVLRKKWVDHITGRPYLAPGDPMLATCVAEITKWAQSRWDDMEKSPERSHIWRRARSTTDSSQITASYRWLHAMAVALRTKGSPLENNRAMTRDVIDALDWLHEHRYRDDSSRYGNWWDWEIGVPQYLCDIVALLYDDLTPRQRDDYTRAVLAKVKSGLTYTGANGTWQTKIWALTGMLRKNKDADGRTKNFLGEARDRIDTTLSAYVAKVDGDGFDREGFHWDGTYIEHRYHPYTGGYGVSFLDDLTSLNDLLAGSRWEPAGMENVLPWIYEGYMPSMHGMVFFDSLRGRYLTRAGTTVEDMTAGGRTVAAAALKIAENAPAPQKLRIQRIVKEWHLANPRANLLAELAKSSPSAYALAKRVFADPRIERSGPITDYRQYPVGSRAVVHRPGYAAAIAMYNKDTAGGSRMPIKSNESLNGETTRGAHLGDGWLQILDADTLQYDAAYYGNLDWSRIPGTTVAYGLEIPEAGQRYVNRNNWAGGVKLDEFGATGFQLHPADEAVFGDLHARKAWFCFDEEIVCLGADICGSTGSAEAEFQTIVENRKLDGKGGNAFVVDGAAQPAKAGWAGEFPGAKWAALSGNVPGSDMGYVFPGGANLSVVRDGRGDEEDGATFLTMWLGHGSQPKDEGYAYILLPTRDAGQTKGYARRAPVEILENSAEAQAAAKPSIGITGALFLADRPKTIQRAGRDYLRCDTIAAVMVRESSTESRIAVSDPLQENQGVIRVELCRPALSVGVKSPEIRVVQLAPTIQIEVDVRGSKGRSFSVTFVTPPSGPGITQHTSP